MEPTKYFNSLPVLAYPVADDLLKLKDEDGYMIGFLAVQGRTMAFGHTREEARGRMASKLARIRANGNARPTPASPANTPAPARRVARGRCP